MILAIDQGTTGTRAMLVNDEGSPVSVSYRSHRQITPRPGWVEHDPEEIWRNVEVTIGTVLAQATVRPSELAGIGIDNQGETVMAWDAITTAPVANAIIG
jgi:glycerol kinase